MPFVTSVDPAQGLTRVWFDGTVTGRDIITATDALIAAPHYDSAFDQLWVLRDVVSLSISPEEMSALIAHDREMVEGGAMGRVCVAIVVSGEARELVILLYRHHMLATGQDIRLFAREEEAEAWLRQPVSTWHSPG